MNADIRPTEKTENHKTTKQHTKKSKHSDKPGAYEHFGITLTDHSLALGLNEWVKRNQLGTI